jgi:hypothetical protein
MRATNPKANNALLMTLSSLSVDLAASGRSSAIDLGLRDSACLNQPADAGIGQLIAMPAHAVLQASCFEPPLAAKPPVVLCAFPFAGHRGAGGAKNDCKNNEQGRALVHL